MAVAVGVAVVALGAGVAGRLLQPHQHVYLRRQQERERLPVWQPSTSGLLQAHATSSGLTLGCSPQRRPWTKTKTTVDSGPGFQGSNPGSTTYEPHNLVQVT